MKMKKLNSGLRKFLKGMFGIFMIKLVVLSVILIYQSCQDSETFEVQQTSNRFINSMLSSSKKLEAVEVKNYDYYILQSASDVRTNENDLSPVITIKANPNEDVEDSPTFDKLTELINSGVLIPDEEEECEAEDENNICHVVYVNENEVIQSLNPAIIQAKDYLNSKGLNESEIIEILEGEDESLLIPIVMGMTTVDLESGSYSSRMNINLLGSSLYAQNTQELVDVDKAVNCAIAALGLDIFDAFREIGEQGLKKALKSLVKTVGKRLLGPISVAIFVAEWALCYAAVS